tara:strand:- start:1 stop:129 length:129 start_codon:yes stop_codon:yes gene_type:complete
MIESNGSSSLPVAMEGMKPWKAVEGQTMSLNLLRASKSQEVD